MTGFAIRPLTRGDYPDWLTLWDGNNEGRRNQDVTDTTWERLNDPKFPVYGVCAMMDKTMTGILHYVLHFTTGNTKQISYVQDVYVDPAYRGRGIGTALMHHVATLGREQKWGRIYWLAEAKNEAAQALYKNLGVKLDFTLHVWPLGNIKS